MRKMHSRAAAAHWAANGPCDVQSHGELRFVGPVAWSYAEPVAFMDEDRRVFVTTARFSMTTSHHRGKVATAAALAGLKVRDIDHGELREMVRAAGQGYSLGSWGAEYDRGAVA